MSDGLKRPNKALPSLPPVASETSTGASENHAIDGRGADTGDGVPRSTSAPNISSNINGSPPVITTPGSVSPRAAYPTSPTAAVFKDGIRAQHFQIGAQRNTPLMSRKKSPVSEVRTEAASEKKGRRGSIMMVGKQVFDGLKNAGTSKKKKRLSNVDADEIFAGGDDKDVEELKARYDKWKREHIADTQLKLKIMSEENSELREKIKAADNQLTAWKSSYEAAKEQLKRKEKSWSEERAKMLKQIQEDKKRLARFKKQRGGKGSAKPQGLPKFESGSFNKSPKKPNIQKVPVKSPRLNIGEPRLLREKDSTPTPVLVQKDEAGYASHRIRVVSDFKLLAVLGQGGFGAVFLAQEQASGAVVAVKRMSKQVIINKKQVHTVFAEVDVLKGAMMEDSRWIVQLLYAFQDPCYVYLAMEFCAGGDLRNLIDNVELDEMGAKFFSAEMIVSVNSLHDRGFVHRDLKPSNFLISSSGHLKLADFGLSKTGFQMPGEGGKTKLQQAIRVFLPDNSYKTIVVTEETTSNECIKMLKNKLRIPKPEPFLMYECSVINGLTRERPMQLNECALATANAWKKSIKYKFLFKQADRSRISAMTKQQKVDEKSHRDPFSDGTEKKGRRERLYSVVGSPHYMAAEILQGSGYESVVDWWSIGCIMYEMMMGVPPFTGATAEEVFEAVLKGGQSLEFAEKEEPLTEDAKNVIRAFLSPPKERLGYNGVGEIKQHPFFRNVNWSAVHLMAPTFEPDLDGPEDCDYFEAATKEGIEERSLNEPTPNAPVIEAAEDPFQKDEKWDFSANL